jgi:hypothetical protein
MLRALTRPVRLVLPLLALGCEVAAVESVAPAVAVNRCGEEDSPPCTKGVATCENGRCVAIKGSFSTILLDIHVPASGTASSGLSYLWREDNVDLAGDTWDIQLAPATDVIGSVTASPYVMNPGSDDECVLEFAGQEPGRTVPAAEDGSIPVDVLFFPADRVLGIENAGYTAKVDTTLVEQSGGVPPSYVFQTSLPQGEYDLYVKPRAAAEGACQLPPWLYRRSPVVENDVGVGLKFPEPSRFELTVVWGAGMSPAQPPPEGWTVEMLDPISGRLVSTQAKLSPSGKDSELSAVIYYIPPEPLPPDKSELLRLTPPPNVTAPTVVFARSALELFSKGSGIIQQFQNYPDAVRVQGQVTGSDALPAAATVTLTAKKIEGVEEGIFASFVRTVEVGAEGTFEVDLLPGTYRVLAVPTKPTDGSGVRTSAVTEREWIVAAEPVTQAGKLIELDPVVKVSGTAFVPQGEPALGAAVVAVASPRSLQIDLLTQAAEGSTPFAPSAESGTVGADGAFSMLADPGDFDISVRPPADSGFAWLVTHYPVRQPTSEPAVLGGLKMPYPVPYTGRVTVNDPNGGREGKGSIDGLAQALIRAFIYLDEKGAYIDDPTRAASVLQIGETRANQNGDFELLIPANLN